MPRGKYGRSMYVVCTWERLYVRCPTCSRYVALTKRGIIARHGPRGGTPCVSSGVDVATLRPHPRLRVTVVRDPIAGA